MPRHSCPKTRVVRQSFRYENQTSRAWVGAAPSISEQAPFPRWHCETMPLSHLEFRAEPVWLSIPATVSAIHYAATASRLPDYLTRKVNQVSDEAWMSRRPGTPAHG